MMTQLNHHGRNRNYTIIVILLALAVVLYFLTGRTPVYSVSQNTEKSHKETVKQEPENQDFQDASYEGNGKWYGLCKKNSIQSIDDFRKLVAQDPVLKAHYADFKWENAAMGKLEKATRAYVHYRKNDTIFRKKTPIVLPPGDGYITDGNTKVRTMCCNSYAVVPPLYETSDLDAEPSAGPQPLNVNNYSPPPESIEKPIPEEVLKEPVFTKENPVVPPTFISSNPPGNEPLPPSPIHHDDPKKPEPPEPPEPPNPKPVPINAAIWLLGTGLVTLIGYRRRFKK